MNRYVASGLLEDMRAGKRVLVVSDTQSLARYAWAEVAVSLREDERSVGANGHERCEAYGGGWIRFGSKEILSARGVDADVLLLDVKDPMVITDDLYSRGVRAKEVIRR